MTAADEWPQWRGPAGDGVWHESGIATELPQPAIPLGGERKSRAAIACPRVCVAIHDGLAYTFGTMGDLHCLDAKSGKVVWRKDLLEEYGIRMPV